MDALWNMRHKEEIKRKKCNSKQTAIKKLSFFMRKMRGKERDMNFGQGIYTWLMTNIQPLVLGGIIIVGLVLLFKHKIAELIVFAIIAVIAVGFVFNPSGTKDTMLKIYNGTIIEGGAADDGGE
jgi:hypothetical protein